MNMKGRLLKILISSYSLLNRNSNNRKGMYSVIFKLYRKKIEAYYEVDLSGAKIDEEGKIIVGRKPLAHLLSGRLTEKKYVERILSIKQELKERLIRNLEDRKDHLDTLKSYVDYESLMLDTLIDYRKIPSDLLVIRTGRYSYLQLEMFNLMHQGYQLSKKENAHNSWLKEWNDEWYAQYILCRHFISFEILTKFDDSLVKEFVKSNTPKYSTLSETDKAIKELQREMMLYGAEASSKYDLFVSRNPKLRYYVQFVCEAMEYNDELNILRSRAIYLFLSECARKKLNTIREIIKVISMIKSDSSLSAMYDNQ